MGHEKELSWGYCFIGSFDYLAVIPFLFLSFILFIWFPQKKQNDREVCMAFGGRITRGELRCCQVTRQREREREVARSACSAVRLGKLFDL